MDCKYVIFIVSYFLLLVESKKDKFLYCAVCRTILKEVNLAIEKEDPKKTIEVGSYRIDSHGNHGRKQVPYAGSVDHLTAILENVCNNMDDYGKILDDQGRGILAKMYGEDGVQLTIKQIVPDQLFDTSIRYYCDSIIEDYEEELINVLKNKSEDLESKICTDICDLCTSEDLKVQLPVLGPQEADEKEDDDEEEEEEDEENNDENDEKDEL